jgi:lipopolysaccharide transport system permease protein
MTADTQGTPTIVIQPTRGLASLQLKALWEYRELLGFLVWRDVKVRYKQTALGVAWIILQPLVSMVIFTMLFGYCCRRLPTAHPIPSLPMPGCCPGTTSPAR